MSQLSLRAARLASGLAILDMAASLMDYNAFMRQIIGIYKLAKVIDDRARHIEVPSDSNAKRYNIGRPATSDVIAAFNRRYRKIGDRELRLILGLGIENEYIKEVESKESFGNSEIEIHVMQVEKKGRQLLDTPPGLPFLPVGLWRELLAQYGDLVKFLLGALFGSAALALIKFIIELYRQFF
jgi:hypothetical protein